jgi:DNA helicase IV
VVVVDATTNLRGSLDPETRVSEPDPELAAEQRYVDRALARLDAMRGSASRVSEAYADVQRGGTHQARLERDIAQDVTHRRLAALDIGDASLVFGRLDLQPGPEREPRLYVGRLAVDDVDRTPLVIDWRAPVAEPFYRATAIEPMSVIRRRHFITHGADLIGLDDEVFDTGAASEAGFRIVGEGALLAALDQERTGRMHDIVATIQSEQDEAIRSDLAGVLVVAGGAGTGKTAVALHRAAYLLYTYRRQLQNQGVLLLGPSPVFLRYIEEVLPSLGEHEVHLATLATLRPEARPRASEEAAVSAVKGDLRMAQVIRKALGDREHVLPHNINFLVDGLALRISRRDSSRIVARAKRRRGTHNARRPYVAALLIDVLVRRYRNAATEAYRGQPLFQPDADEDGTPMLDPTVAGTLARGEAPPPEWEEELRQKLRRRPEVREALERMWPVLTGAELVRDLLGFPQLIHSASAGVLTATEESMLYRPRTARHRDTPWTEGDVALVDEAEALLGPVEEARSRRSRRGVEEAEALRTATRVVEEMGLGGYTDAATLAARFGEPAIEAPPSASELRTYGHVLVDEAQDLTPMQWRMVGRRVPSGSLSLVGDFGQASRPGAADGWDTVIDQLRPRAGSRLVQLTVNYRTPAEIMAVAHRILTVAAPNVEPTRAVRRTGEHPRFLATDTEHRPGVVGGAARRALDRGGKVAVIAPEAMHEAIVAELSDVHAISGTTDALDAPVTVLTPMDAKGLEFDHVVVVEPVELVAPDPAGLRLLYVALTRATTTLTVVHALPLPEALSS